MLPWHVLRHLQQVQTGFLSSRDFTQKEITKRCLTLKLSRHLDIDSATSASVNSVDIERLENRYLLSGSDHGTLFINDLHSSTDFDPVAKCVGEVPPDHPHCHRKSIECVSWYGKDSALFISSSADKTLKIWDANSLRAVETYHAKGRIYYHDCSSAPSSNPIIAIASAENYVELIDLRTSATTHKLRGHKQGVWACRWSPADDNYLATGGADEALLLWDIRSSQACLRSFVRKNGKAHRRYVNGVRFTSDGRHVVSVGGDQRILLWTAHDGRVAHDYYPRVKNRSGRTNQFAISDNSRPDILYLPSGRKIYVVDLVTGTLVNTLSGHVYDATCAVYRDTFQELYTCGMDGTLLLWTADCTQDDICLEHLNERRKMT